MVDCRGFHGRETVMNPEEEQLKKLHLQKNAFTVHNFYELDLVEPDHAIYSLRIRPQSLNPHGTVHGGALYTMADDAAGSAVHTDGRRYVTQHGDLHFLKNQSSGVIRAEGRVRRRGQVTALVAVDITNEAGELLATGQFSFFCIDQA